MAKMKVFDWVLFSLVSIGAINWGLVGAFNYNLVESIFGIGMLTKFIYSLVGISGVIGLVRIFMKK